MNKFIRIAAIGASLTVLAAPIAMAESDHIGTWRCGATTVQGPMISTFISKITLNEDGTSSDIGEATFYLPNDGGSMRMTMAFSGSYTLSDDKMTVSVKAVEISNLVANGAITKQASNEQLQQNFNAQMNANPPAFTALVNELTDTRLVFTGETDDTEHICIK